MRVEAKEKHQKQLLHPEVSVWFIPPCAGVASGGQAYLEGNTTVGRFSDAWLTGQGTGLPPSLLGPWAYQLTPASGPLPLLFLQPETLLTFTEQSPCHSSLS
jgi:hypothetical protein